MVQRRHLLDVHGDVVPGSPKPQLRWIPSHRCCSLPLFFKRACELTVLLGIKVRCLFEQSRFRIGLRTRYLRVLLVFLGLVWFHAEHVDPFDGRTWLMWIFPGFGKFVGD